MNYKVLYRKYRPDNFENIVGQEYIIKTLQNSIINKNISHAYIFSGPRGTGKTSTAKVFAKAINCLESNNGQPCGKCEFCANFSENPDIIEIDAASNNGVDEIRNLIDNIKLTPSNGMYKVYIIDEVHMLTTSAFNALLLTLEEPPKHAIFILATTNIENVPITILSRCQRYDFQKIKVSDITSRLKDICNKEKIDIEDDALNEIAYLSEGGLRDALSLLDQLSKNSQKITLNLIENQIKTISKKNILDLLDSIEDNNIDKFLEYINDYRLRAVDYKTLIKKMIEIISERAKIIKKTCKYKRLDFTSYKKMIMILSECINKININVDSYTILEMNLLDFFDIKFEEDNTLKNKVEITENLEKKEIVEKIENNNNITDLVNIRINNCFVNAQKSYLENIKEIIRNFLSSSDISGKIKALLLDSTVVAASDIYVIFSSENEQIASSANKILKEIEKEIEKFSSKALKIIFISKMRWNEEKAKYIENLKNKVNYSFMDELETKNEVEKLIINDIFDISKIEII